MNVLNLNLSLVIPSYNEANRLPAYLRSIREHFDGEFAGCYEVIVVDDGSLDDSAVVRRRLAADWPQLSVLRHQHN